MNEMLLRIKELKDRSRVQKNKDDVIFYSTIIGEIENALSRNSNKTQDEIIIGILNKFKNDATLYVQMSENISGEKKESLNREIDLITELLPKTLSNDELEDIIKSFFHKTRLATQPFNVPWVMQYLNKEFPNRFDRKHAAHVVKTQYENSNVA